MYRGFPAKCVEELTKGYVKDTVYPRYSLCWFCNSCAG